MAKFIAVVHIYLNSPDYVAAISESDDIKINVESRLLETDDDESFEIIELIEADDKPMPSEQIMHLRRARNILIAQRSAEAYETARALDEQAFAMAMRTDPQMVRGSYDYGNMMRVVK